MLHEKNNYIDLVKPTDSDPIFYLNGDNYTFTEFAELLELSAAETAFFIAKVMQNQGIFTISDLPYRSIWLANQYLKKRLA